MLATSRGLAPGREPRCASRPTVASKDADPRASPTDRVQDRYQKLEKIGEGSCGVVFKCRDRVDDRIVAVKKINFSYEGDSGKPFGVPVAALREISVLKSLSGHPNIVTLFDAVVERERVFLICQFLDSDLRCHINELGHLHPMRTKLYSWQVLQALAHCHSHRVAHRDVKPQNLLVERATDTVTLCDFSLSRFVLSPLDVQTRRVASLWYRSPEILLGGQAQGMLLDCWSVGCVLGEMLLNAPMFPGTSEIETVFFHFKVLGSPTEATWPGVSKLPHWSQKFPKFAPPEHGIALDAGVAASSLLGSLLRWSPVARSSMERAATHVYFADLDTTGHAIDCPALTGQRDDSSDKFCRRKRSHEGGRSLKQCRTADSM